MYSVCNAEVMQIVRLAVVTLVSVGIEFTMATVGRQPSQHACTTSHHSPPLLTESLPI